MNILKSKIRKYLPESFLLAYHKLLAFFAACWYGFPASKMIMIGITGTKGKTSTANFVWAALEHSGINAGLIGTANIRIGEVEHMNEYHMTMPGPFVTQKLLRQMYKQGIRAAILEVTSEGLKQNRHLYMYFDIAVFTNLTPEHLPSHDGDFEEYKKAKGKLFTSLDAPNKEIDGVVIEKLAILNADDQHSNYYASLFSGKKITYGIRSGEVFAKILKEDAEGVTFVASALQFRLNVLGGFNVYNALPAIIIGARFNISSEKIKHALATLTLIPGRMERIDAGQPFTVIVDYAHEKISMGLLMDAMKTLKGTESKIIVAIGAEGGGRDKAKREHLGSIAGREADYVIVTTVDPYDDDPMEIIEGVAHFARKEGKCDGEDLFCILDRREGIRRALSLARPHDIVVITAKGSEQSIVIRGEKIPWDDRTVIRELLRELNKK